ncbi:hypothetical protein GGS20DRAFT_574560 [Poronia punctata]|nr:hypothetical protein GGS20DRAFT_574560 [Poronia punctata]
MPKWDKTRNYYADLELSSTATTEEIKRQFRKLALKYHPDRNPGREVEVQSKFQIIQSAHEILTDETLRSQYDEARRSTRYPAASGVRGNPWQDAGKAYPPPPRRQNNQTRPASGARRYEDFTSSMPRNSRPQTPRDDPQFRRSNADAWDNLRPNSSRKQPQQPPPTPNRAPPGRAPTSATRESRPGPAPVPPRTAYQKQKAEAAFGTSRKTGFTPSAPGVADEPPVTNKNYFTTRTHSYFGPSPAQDTRTGPDVETTSQNHSGTAGADPLAQFREKFMDTRQSTPYHSPGGEKTSLFDPPSGLGRSASTRVPPRAAEMPGAFPNARPRSSTPSRSSSNDGGSEDSNRVNRGGFTAQTTAQSRAGDRYRPKPAKTATTTPTSKANPTNASMPNATTAPNATPVEPGNPKPSGYAHQTFPTKSQSTAGTPRPDVSGKHTSHAKHLISLVYGRRVANSSSEEKKARSSSTLLPIEVQQRTALDRLLRKVPTAGNDGGSPTMGPQRASSISTASHPRLDANCNRASSFYFAGPKSPTAEANAKSFTRHSTDNINTRFVDDEIINDWQFKAGSASATEGSAPPRPRRPIRRPTPLTSPLTTPFPPREPPPQAGDSPNSDEPGSFSAGKWSEKIGPQHFEPQPMASSSTSPSRRPNLRKTKSFKTNPAKATVADESEGEGLQQESPTAPKVPAAAVAEDDAMDIDSPPPKKAAEDVQKPAKVNTARKYSTEPYRAEWRAGDANGASAESSGLASSTNGAKDVSGVNDSKPAGNTTFPSYNMGSEDTEEFQTTFADFKKVEPFAEPAPTGLKSWQDVKSTLPFPSKPSEQIPVEVIDPSLSRPLTFPTVPVAPRPPQIVAGTRPSNLSFRKYSQDFNTYMDKWEVFEDEIVTHIATRQKEYKQRRSRRGPNWLEECAGSYLCELDQDLGVQRKHADACAEHRRRIAEYIDFRDRVK